MTITTKQARDLRTRITKLVNAEREDSWKGSKMPEEWPRIDENLRIARKRVHEAIEALKLPDGRIRP
jgi:hypothetical protein